MSLKREENKCADSASGSALSDDNNGAIYSEGGSVNDDNIMQLNVDTIQGLKIYDNLFGINAIDNWSTPNWPLPQIPGHHSSSPTNVDSNLGMLNDEKDAKDDLPTQNIFKTVDQQGSSLQFSMEQLQIKTQLQVR